ncbi:MAG: Transcriptional repressor SdpR [Candidatus Dichloromethanomonas elyunquensis]|nr:MAG: Transcriptional repressor SdpR [Candidatus Dichloromethanomonas elyunquensis]
MSPYNDTFKALADPNRREIIRLLKEKRLTAGEIADQFDISKPSISHHLNLLKHAGLVDDERKGQNIIYALNTSVAEDIMRMILDLFNWDNDKKNEFE